MDEAGERRLVALPEPRLEGLLRTLVDRHGSTSIRCLDAEREVRDEGCD
jgi:hypothetical protein